MIGQAGGHRGGARLPTPLGIALAQRADWPAEIVAVHAQAGCCIVHIGVFAEAISLACLTRVAMAVGGVVTFDECGVDLLQCPRRF